MSRVRQVILETLSQRGPLPLEEIAGAAHLSKMAARYHLSLLARERLVAVKRTKSRGTVGRPPVVFGPAPRAQKRLPKQYPWLAQQVLATMQTMIGGKGTRAWLRQAGRRVAEAAPSLPPRTSLFVRLKRAAKFLSTRGYMARLERLGEGYSLRVSNCPYYQVAQKNQQVCEMDIAMVAALLERPIQMTHSVARRDAVCEFMLAERK